MLKADFHTHTTYCDGKNTPAEMVKAAYNMGFTDFGISGHGDYSPAEPGFGMTDSILSSYMKELYELREQYRGKMNLYIGIETDCLGSVQKAEYTIGSTHYLEKNGTFASPATAFASIVLPVPGGPTRRIPFGIDAPISLYLAGL